MKNQSLLQKNNTNSVGLPPPLAKGLPILGNALGLAGSDINAFLRNKYLESGPIYRISALNKQFVVFAGQEANLFFAKEGAKYFSSNDVWQSFKEDLGASKIIASEDGYIHTKLRNLQQSGYSHIWLEKQLDRAVAIVRQEIANWSTVKPLSVFYLMQRIVIQQIGFLLTNYSPHDYVDDLISFSKNVLTTNLLKRPKFLTYYPAKRAKARVFELVEKVMDIHADELKDNREPDLIDDLLQFIEQEPEFLGSHADKALVAMGPFMGAVDTVAGTTSFMLYALFKHPDILERAILEAKSLFANGIPTPNSLKSLDVLHRTILETLRMYPTVPVLPRTVTADFEFMGYQLKAGETALIATTVPHHLPEFYPNPFKFDIDRYTKDRAEHLQPGVFAPFGLGPHTCIAKNLALALIPFNVATILQAVSLSMFPTNYELRLNPIPMPSPDTNFKVRIIEKFGQK
ncbi:MAG: cytochrome P450 [Cyanobacteria bacterium P01_A01_bin.84]